MGVVSVLGGPADVLVEFPLDEVRDLSPKATLDTDSRLCGEVDQPGECQGCYAMSDASSDTRRRKLTSKVLRVGIDDRREVVRSLEYDIRERNTT